MTPAIFFQDENLEHFGVLYDLSHVSHTLTLKYQYEI